MRLFPGAGVLATAVWLACFHTPAQTRTRAFQDNGAALLNPGMGLVFYFYSNEPGNYGSKLSPSDTLDDFPGLSTVYLRVPWSFIEPEEGHYNWTLLDTPAQRWIAKGKRIALRITCSENWIPFATPEWLKRAGAKGFHYQFGKGPVENGPLWDPDFGDPVFLAKLENLLRSMAARYDTNPDVAFIDIGTFGLWGEGHTFMSSQVPEEKALEQVKKHIDLHTKYFQHTQLCISDDVAGHDKPGRHFPATDYALSHGVSLRDDSILVQPPPRSWYHAEMAQEFWPRFPVILEHEHYGGSKARKAWDGSLLLKAVADYHASYLSIHWWPRELLAENRETFDQINRRLGYRFHLRNISWPEAVKIGQPFTLAATWANTGVAPCYKEAFPALTIRDSTNGIVSVLSDDSFDFRKLKPAAQAPVTLDWRPSFTIGRIAPVTTAGDYSLFISVGRRDGTPQIALPIDGDDGQRRYKIGAIKVQ